MHVQLLEPGKYFALLLDDAPRAEDGSVMLQATVLAHDGEVGVYVLRKEDLAKINDEPDVFLEEEAIGGEELDLDEVFEYQGDDLVLVLINETDEPVAVAARFWDEDDDLEDDEEEIDPDEEDDPDSEPSTDE